MLIVLWNQWCLCQDNEVQSPDMREVIRNTYCKCIKSRHIKTRNVKTTHIQRLTDSSLPNPSCPHSLSLNRWHIYMHHQSEKDEFNPHGRLFLLYFKENSRINPLFLHIYFYTYWLSNNHFLLSLYLKPIIIIEGKIIGHEMDCI